MMKLMMEKTAAAAFFGALLARLKEVEEERALCVSYGGEWALEHCSKKLFLWKPFKFLRQFWFTQSISPNKIPFMVSYYVDLLLTSKSHIFHAFHFEQWLLVPKTRQICWRPFERMKWCTDEKTESKLKHLNWNFPFFSIVNIGFHTDLPLFCRYWMTGEKK